MYCRACILASSLELNEWFYCLSFISLHVYGVMVNLYSIMLILPGSFMDFFQSLV